MNKSEWIDHPPASEIAPGLCVIHTFTSMLRKIGVAEAAADILKTAAARRTEEMETARIARAEHVSQRLSKFSSLSLDEIDAVTDQQINRVVAVAVRSDGMRIRQLYIDQLSSLKKAGILPNDATLEFDSGDLPSAYGMTKRDLLVGVRIMFTLDGRVMSHIFHLGIDEKIPPYYLNLSDKPGSGIAAITELAIHEGRLDQIMQNPARLGKTWNIVALYPGLENVRRMHTR